MDQSSQTHTQNRKKPEGRYQKYLNLIDRTKSSKLVRYILIGIMGFMIGYIYTFISSSYNVADLAYILRANAFWGAMTWGLTFGLIDKKLFKALKLGISGVFGFFIGFILIYPLFSSFFFFIAPLFIGIIGGTFQGIALMNFKRKEPFIQNALRNFMALFSMQITGGIGVTIGLICYFILSNAFLAFASYGIIVGAFLGAGMYFAEKEDIRQR